MIEFNCFFVCFFVCLMMKCIQLLVYPKILSDTQPQTRLFFSITCISIQHTIKHIEWIIHTCYRYQLSLLRTNYNKMLMISYHIRKKNYSITNERYFACNITCINFCNSTTICKIFPWYWKIMNFLPYRCRS